MLKWWMLGLAAVSGSRGCDSGKHETSAPHTSVLIEVAGARTDELPADSFADGWSIRYDQFRLSPTFGLDESTDHLKNDGSVRLTGEYYFGGQLLELTDPKTNAEVDAWIVAGRSPGFGMRLRRWLRSGASYSVWRCAWQPISVARTVAVQKTPPTKRPSSSVYKMAARPKLAARKAASKAPGSFDRAAARRSGERIRAERARRLDPSGNRSLALRARGHRSFAPTASARALRAFVPRMGDEEKMTEPHDYRESGSGRLASELLSAGRSERASAAARNRAQQAVLVGAAVSSVARVKAGVWLSTVKWLGVSALLLGAGSGLWRAISSTMDKVERPAQLRSAPPPVAQSLAASTAIDSSAINAPPSSGVVQPTANVELPLSSAAAPSAPSSSGPARASAAVPKSGAEPRLTHELLAISAARAAIARGAPERALTALDSVSGGFRVLSLEANVVRVEAWRGVGQWQAARALSERLLREQPDGPYTERLRALAASFRSAQAGQHFAAE
jgi:hypothetical protein